MHTDRRSFLKTTAVGIASATATSFAATAPPEVQRSTPATFEMPRNMTLVNMRTEAGPGLGVKVARGILDVAAAAAVYKLPAPLDTDDLLQRGRELAERYATAGEVRQNQLGAILQAVLVAPAETGVFLVTSDYRYADQGYMNLVKPYTPLMVKITQLTLNQP